MRDVQNGEFPVRAKWWKDVGEGVLQLKEKDTDLSSPSHLVTTSGFCMFSARILLKVRLRGRSMSIS
jgi:hypothetical protein